MVFSQGTVLAAGTWDPHSGMEIDLVILQLLNQANNAALNAGVALSPERRGAVLLPGNYFFDAIEASRAIKQPVEIRLVVAEDSWRSTSPVLLYLEMFPRRKSQSLPSRNFSPYGKLLVETTPVLWYNAGES